MDDVVQTAISNPNDTENFAKWIGIDPDSLKADAEPEPETEAPQAEDAESVPAPEAPEADAEGTDDDVEKEQDAAPEQEPEPEPIKLPFDAKAGEEAVDPTLLNEMTLTFKADGKDVTLSLSDVVRRAQSEPAAQRRVREVGERLESLEAEYRQAVELAERRAEIALRMARDPDFYAETVAQVEAYDTPEARAERLEAELKAEREGKRREAEQAQFAQRVQQFATEVIAPTLDNLLTKNPLVSEQEILGQFYLDTAAITVNGVIPPQHYEQLASYLKNDLADFVAKRQAEYAAREKRVKDQERKTQIERQKLKNQTAAATAPVGTVGNPTRDTQPAKAPRNAKEAADAALNVLMGGLS